MLCPDFVRRFFRTGGGCVRKCPWGPSGVPTSLSGTLPRYSKRTGERENRDFCKSPNLTSWRQGGPCRVIIRASSSGGRFYKSCRSDHSRMEQCRLSCSRSVSIPKFVFRLSSSFDSRWIDGYQEFLPVPVLSILFDLRLPNLQN